MTTKYIGTNSYRYRYFKSPLGFTKFLLDVFTNTRYINMAEHNLPNEITEEQIAEFAKREVRYYESMT